MFALVHVPSPHMNHALRTFIDPHPIHYDVACRQHDGYCQALVEAGATVRKLDANRELPDCVFIEDSAIVLDELAVLCSMGHVSRRGEPAGILPALEQYREVRQIELPATIDGGDVLRVGRTLLVGLSGRTNAAAVESLKSIVTPHGYTVRGVHVHGCLHLKSAVTALPDGRLLANREWLDRNKLKDFPLIDVPQDEPDAANVAFVNSTVLASTADPQTLELLEREGYQVRPVELDEFAKAEGCVTCLSLIFRSTRLHSP